MGAFGLALGLVSRLRRAPRYGRVGVRLQDGINRVD